MNTMTVLVLRAVIALLLAGGALIVTVMAVGLVTADEDVGGVPVQAFFGVLIPGFLAGIVILVCVWTLLTMAHRRTVFTRSAFRYVDVVIGALTLIAVLIGAFAGLLTFVNADKPEDDQLAPGLVAMVCGVGLAVFGIALTVLVVRALLAQAVELKDELAEVI